jgi:hypothetical protein
MRVSLVVPIGEFQAVADLPGGAVIGRSFASELLVDFHAGFHAGHELRARRGAKQVLSRGVDAAYKRRYKETAEAHTARSMGITMALLEVRHRRRCVLCQLCKKGGTP